MTAPIIVQAMRFGFLALLWIFVFAAYRVIRTDIFTDRGRSGLAAAPRPVHARPVKTGRRSKVPRTLVVTGGGRNGTKLPLGEQVITIGRANDSTLVLTDDYASSRHARLTPRDGEWYVEDLGSTNGTYLDDAKVTGPMPVGLGQPIAIGKTTIELRT
ncbi:MAG: FHA domain-containing protein FhaB/FipA [Mycobacteriales bacterium]